MLSDANLQISQKITTITNLAKVSLIKDTGNQGLKEVLKFRKNHRSNKIFLLQQEEHVNKYRNNKRNKKFPRPTSAANE